MKKTLFFQTFVVHDNGFTKYNKLYEDSKKSIRDLAFQTGSDYLFTDDPYIDADKYGYFRGDTYEKLRPLYDDRFLEYDKIIYLDTDIIPGDGASEILQIPVDNLGIALMPVKDKRTRESVIKCHRAYGGQLPPMDDNGEVLWYNSGVMIWSQKGLREARKKFVHVSEHKVTNHYTAFGDETFWNNNIQASGMHVDILDPTWNFEVNPDSPLEARFYHYSGWINKEYYCNMIEQEKK